MESDDSKGLARLWTHKRHRLGKCHAPPPAESGLLECAWRARARRDGSGNGMPRGVVGDSIPSPDHAIDIPRISEPCI